MEIFPGGAIPRTRTDGSTTPVASVEQHNTTYGGIPSEPWRIIAYNQYPYDCNAVMTKVMHDVETVNFTKRRAAGEIICNPYDSTEIVKVDGNGPIERAWINRSSSTPYTYSGIRWQGTFPMFNNGSFALPAAPAVSTDHISEAVTAAWASISGSKTQMLVQGAEAKKTVKSLAQILFRALRIFIALKRLDAKVLLGELKPKELANRYMEARYALRPLYYDAKGIITVFDKHLDRSRSTFRAYRERTGGSTKTGQVLRYLPVESPCGRIYYGTQTASRVLEVRAGVLTDVKALANSELSELGILDIAESAWELVPLSFVVDWFFNVGKYIASWTPNFGFETLASWYVVHDITYLASTVTSAANIPEGNYENSFDVRATMSTTTTVKYRIVDPSRPSLPQFSLNIDWLKSLDLGLILRQFGKIRR